MPVQSNTSRVVSDFQKKISRIVRDFENKIVETIEAFVKAEKKQMLDDVLSQAKEMGVISHPSQEYKEALEESTDKMLQNKELMEEFPKIKKKILELLENDEEAAYLFYQKEFQKHGVNIPIPGEKDGVCTDLQLIKQFMGDCF